MEAGGPPRGFWLPERRSRPGVPPSSSNPLAGRALVSADVKRAGGAARVQGDGGGADPRVGRRRGRCSLTCTRPPWRWATGAPAARRTSPSSELFFRQCPFGGALALAAGLRDCVRFGVLWPAGTGRLRPRRSPARTPPAPARHGLCRPQTPQFLASGAAPRHRPCVL